ncbi:MAG: L-cystine import ATP-binding protein TcyC [Alphaproteobacteria bacterium MarineAlpha8_Bin1]|nr:MAG: L-cystine import ATP-binding protein TcyC [Alphaproteobacteria bacterium MarineAlpha8_Bin1]|tara:strand:- start:1038 stop:1751 length:714 start_codon:yes stop_codon:yes gene_type:complete
MKRKKISIKNLKKKFFEKEVLKKLNLDVFESESLAIIGESGSGKSVLTRCIIGLIEFDEGTVSFEKILNIKDLGFRGRTKYISKFGILFQNSALLDSLTIFENLKLAKNQKNYNKILDDVALPRTILKKYPAEISVGMQKRVGIARAILKNPEVLIFDEPTTGLDPIIARQINLLIKNLVKEKRVTTITVTHDMESVYEFADKTAFIKQGKIVWHGSSKQISTTKNKDLKNFINGKT